MLGNVQIPDGWRVARLGDVARERVQRANSGLRADVLSITNDLGFVQSRQKFDRQVFSQDTSNYKVVRRGDIAYNPARLNVGSIAILTDPEIGIVSPMYVVLESDTTRFLPEFLFRLLKLPSLFAIYRRFGEGTVRSSIGFHLLRNVALAIPPKYEQKQILVVLDAVDDAIECAEAVIAATERLRDALLHELLTRGVPGWHIEWRDVPGLGVVPTEWEVVRLGEVAEVERGKFAHRPRNEPRFYGGEIPFIQTGDIVQAKGRIREHTQTLNDAGLAISRLFPADTIVMTIAANIGETAIAIYPVAFPDSLVGITARHVDTQFLEHFLRTQKERLRAAAPASAQKNINLKNLRPMAVPYPSLEEQHAIAGVLDSLDEAIERARAEREALQSLKVSAAAALLTGRVRVGDQE